MDDRELEDRLRQYRPVGPSPGLRARSLVACVERERRAWPWVAAAAALLVTTVAVHGATVSVTARAAIPTTPDAAARAVLELAEMFGGDPDARRLAEQIMAEEAAERDRIPVVSTLVPEMP